MEILLGKGQLSYMELSKAVRERQHGLLPWPPGSGDNRLTVPNEIMGIGATL